MISGFDGEDALDRTLKQIHLNGSGALLTARRTLITERGFAQPLALSDADLERFGLVPWSGCVFGMQCVEKPL